MITRDVSAPIVRAHARSTSAGLPTISFNWSGYAVAASKPFTYVHTRFVQPAIKCTSRSQVTSNWSGLDGFTTGTVEQDGTFAFCTGSKGTTPVYIAWYEMFPAGSISVFKVTPGDMIDSSVRYTGGKFHLTIADLSSHKSFTKVASCSQCQRASAEWIVERPAECTNNFKKCWLTELADFGTSTMAQNLTQTAGGPVTGLAKLPNATPIFMVTPFKNARGFKSLDEVTGVNPKDNSFTAVWDRPGATVPIQL